MNSVMRSEIQGVGFYVPERIVTNDDLSKLMDTTDAWIKERTGISQRHHIEDDNPESTSDLAVHAIRNTMKMAQRDLSDIDLIIAGTLSPDYYFPGIGAMIQHKLGLKCIPAIDIRAQCSAFSWGMGMADAYIRSGQYKAIMIVGSEIHSRIMELSNDGRNVSVIFGDGAGAMFVEAKASAERPTVENGLRGLIDHYMGSDGSGAELLAMTRPGVTRKDFITPDEVRSKAHLIHMDGKIVFKHAVTRMLESAHKLLERNGLQPDDIDLVVPHQANIRIAEMVREKLGLAPDKVYNNIQKYGNTTSASLPICLSEAVQVGKLKKGTLLLTVAFGSGFTWGGNLIRW